LPLPPGDIVSDNLEMDDEQLAESFVDADLNLLPAYTLDLFTVYNIQQQAQIEDALSNGAALFALPQLLGE
jgi:hypothetical protein